MSDNQEANVSTQPQHPQQQQEHMATAMTDGPSFAPISNRRGGPMDIGEPMHDIQPPFQQQQQRPSMAFSSPYGGETIQQQQQQQQQQGEGQYDPRVLMHPLQPQISNQSTQSNQSFQSFQSFESADSSHQQPQQQKNGGGFSEGSTPYQQQQQPQPQPQPQRHHHQQLQLPYTNPSQATTSSSLTSASGHLAPPQHTHEKPRSRRWSITGRFFEKRKSVTEPFYAPGGAQPSSFSSSYKSTNSNIVGSAEGGCGTGKGDSLGGPESSFGGRANNNGGNFNHINNTSTHQGHLNNNNNNNNHNNNIINNNINTNTDNHNNNNNNNSTTTAASASTNSQSSNNGETGGTDSKNNSPPGSNANSRRSSLADLPKAILSSLRRSSLVGPGDAGSVMTAACAASMTNSGTGQGQGQGGTIADEGEDQDENGTPRVVMAVPKAPPQDPHISRPPPKSILKKRSSEGNLTTAAAAAGGDSAAGGTAASTEETSPSAAAAAAGANATASANNDQQRASADRTISSETVHPMATADMNVTDINLLTPTDHRARLLTHSPPPNHPQQHLVTEYFDKDSNPTLMGGAGSPMPSNNSDSVNSSSNNKVQQGSVSSSSSSSQGAAFPPDFTPGVQSNSYYKDRGGERSQGSVGDFVSQDELLTQQMIGISSRAQDLANQYYGTNTNNQTSATRPSAPIATAAAGASGKRRSINFLETVEIIPAHRKGEYNRQSDKHATFKILTPDMKSEIRDELNTYKMREMAVHVESMANTAFH
ncbi:hypothetical protein BG015_006513 [Linnemannia schmuckeri]|uniref:Uncharacterized protein n=1 Tax=Linnemannia schmuckeri TaxID=64567 RepID=A0A9P5S376_9FUNG|nr:hypothetical protein BG015_006513 [Linnemannia schmuckeri]